MLAQDIVDRSRYSHHGLRSEGRPVRPTNRYDGFIHRIGLPGHGLTPADRSPPNYGDQAHASSGWGEAPLVVDRTDRAWAQIMLSASNFRAISWIITLIHQMCQKRCETVTLSTPGHRGVASLRRINVAGLGWQRSAAGRACTCSGGYAGRQSRRGQGASRCNLERLQRRAA
jgi:hypothetical protein